MADEIKKTKASGSIWPVATLFIIIMASILAVGYFNGKGGKVAGNMDKEDIEEIVGEYILNHPEKIIESVQNMQTKKAEEDQAKAQENIGKKLSDIENDPTSPVVGNPEGDVTVVEFFDYNCGYCKRVQPDVVRLLQEDTNVRFVMKELPILSPVSEVAARAALAVHKIAPDKYLDAHNALMVARLTNEDSVYETIGKLGIDIEAVKASVKDSAVTAVIEKNHDLADDIGVHGTPAFVINGKLIPGAISYGQMQKAVGEARNK